MPVDGIPFTGFIVIFYLSIICIVDFNYNKDKIGTLVSYVAEDTVLYSVVLYTWFLYPPLRMI